MSQYKVAIVGPEGVISGFRALGAESFPAATADEALTQMQELASRTESGEQKYAVVLVIEDLLKEIPEKEYKSVTKNVLPSFVAVPGVEGPKGYMSERLKEFTVRAIGSDIF